MWKLLSPATRLFKKLMEARDHYEVAKYNEVKLNANNYKVLFSDYTVQSGPLKGLKYPFFQATGSAIYPKLILHGFIGEISTNNYSEILDLVCAEKYYAVGFAKRYSRSKVYAYDSNPVAQKLCEQMPVLNGVADLPDTLSLAAKKILYAERPSFMQWYLCLSKQNSNGVG